MHFEQRTVFELAFENWKILISLNLIFLVLLITALIFAVLWKRLQRNRSFENGRSSGYHPVDIEANSYAPRFLETENHRLETIEIIERGRFRKSKNAFLKEKGSEKRVAVFVERKDTTLVQQEILETIGNNPNVTWFLIYPYTVDSPIWEYVEGRPLRCFLKEHKENFINQIVYSELKNKSGYETPKKKMVKTDELLEIENSEFLCTVDLISMAYQVASGMVYLAEKLIVHQNLALHNIYITENRTVRIRGFEFAKAGYYRMSSQTPPIEWTAPETFCANLSNEMADVWSFGVLLFELFTLGDTPNTKKDNIPSIIFGERLGERLTEPEYCLPSVYQLMLTCWDMHPENRPTFSFCQSFFKQKIDSTKIIELDNHLNQEFQTRTENAESFIDEMLNTQSHL